MNQVNQKKIDFAKKAAKAFEDPEIMTYGDSPRPECGEFFAVKWGLGADCVLVFTIGDDPTVFAQFIKKENHVEGGV